MKYSEILSLDRHFLWADFFRQRYYQCDNRTPRVADFQELTNYFISDVGIYMCYWYASLYTVLEGLKSSQIEYVPIEKDILDIIDDLRLFRNVIYHPQPKYLDKRFFLIMGNKNSRNKINKIHLYLDKKLIEVMKNLSQNTSSQDIIEFFKQ